MSRSLDTTNYCPVCVKYAMELKSANARLKIAYSALKVLHTWATFRDGVALKPEDIEDLCASVIDDIKEAR